MAVTEKSTSTPTPPAVSEGELAVRYTLSGSPDSRTFDIDVLIGELSGDPLEYDDEFGAFTALVSSAAKIAVTQSYDNTSRALEKLREGTTFVYDQKMLLRNLLEAEAVPEKVQELSDNDKFRASDLTWQVSVLGFDTMRMMQRELFVASGSPPLDLQAQVPFERTHPEMRADILNFLGGRAVDVFLTMPPTES